MFAIQNKELSASEISKMIELPPSALSHQLAILQSEKLTKRRREGKKVFYSLNDDHVFEILNVGLDHISEEK